MGRDKGEEDRMAGEPMFVLLGGSAITIRGFDPR